MQRLGDLVWAEEGPSSRPACASPTSASSRRSAAGSSGRSPPRATRPARSRRPGSAGATSSAACRSAARSSSRGRVKRFGRRADPRQPRVPVVDGDDDEVLHAGRIVPVYRLTAGLTAARLRSAIREALDRAGPAYPEYLPRGDPRDEDAAPGSSRALEAGPLPGDVRGPRCGPPAPRVRRAPRAPARHGRRAAGSGPAAGAPCRSTSTTRPTPAIRTALTEALARPRRPRRRR